MISWCLIPNLTPTIFIPPRVCVVEALSIWSGPQNRKHKLYQIQTVKRLHNEWIENTDRWATGFLEIFEEGFIRRGLQSEGVFKRGNQKIPRNKLENGEYDDADADDQFYEEYFDHDLGRDEYEDERHYARIKMLKKRKRKLLRRMQKTTRSFHS
ncbi:choline-phosphate cytidylyltransferase 1-like [Brassica napus]|uniref:choline-phosphate cytidylyltransferase 1-like n=1 Tax=Brassica napus TaxID=3708 RepID=UPI000BBE15FD|nr:choline-phosphate cytidylyltransferase 1-like [Brassica napus]XP_048636308.1 choline-phosphate cytidylyltransferase 1-like [Brassica napus]